MRASKIVGVMISLVIVLSLSGGCECGTPITSGITVKINEIMFNPFGEDAGKEWIELYNSDLESHSIKEWTISNGAGDTIATLPDWFLPPGSYLLIALGGGLDDNDFSDDAGVFHTQGNVEVLDNSEDEVALYAGSPERSNLLDFISWCSDGDYDSGAAYSHAVKAKQWPKENFFDIGFPSGKPSVGGFSIGRDKDSTDTDSPDDWDRNGGRDAYFDTPGLVNAGPYFTTDWGIKLTQTQVNLLLLFFDRQITHASHETISEQQSPEESYVKAEHSFNTTYAGCEDTFTGIGEYRWERVDSQKWQDEIDISLTASTGGESYSLHYARQYEDTRLTLIITETLEGIYRYEIFDEEEVLADVNPEWEPVPEASTHTEQKRFYDTTTTTITQVALDEYRVETTSDKFLPFRDEEQVWTFTKDYKLVTDTQIEATTALEVTSSFRDWEFLTISTQYFMNTPDVGWHRAHDLGNIDVSYSKYDLKLGDGQSYSLVEPGFLRMTKQAGRDYYDVDCGIELSDGADVSFSIDYLGYVERTTEDGEVIYKGEISDPTQEWVRQFYIDGIAGGAIGGGACAVAGAAIGAWWIGIGGLIGAGIGGVVCGIGGAIIEDATEPDNTKPDIEWKIEDSGSDKEKGWLNVVVTVSDDSEVTEWSLEAMSEEGNTLTSRSYKPGTGSSARRYPLVNRHCQKRTITLTVSVTDSSGNTRTDSKQFDVPARICTPNVEKTKPADKDVGVPVDSKSEVTFCKPMDTAATASAFSFSPPVDFTVSWSNYNTVAILTPSQSLEHGTTYTVTISTAARSFAGYPLEEPYTFSFTTEVASEPPEVLSTLPPDGAEGVSLDTELEIIFSKPMDKDATAEALIIFPEAEYEVFWEEDNQIMFIRSLVPWEPATTYEVTITTEARSTDGLNMEDDHTFTFTTVESP